MPQRINLCIFRLYFPLIVSCRKKVQYMFGLSCDYSNNVTDYGIGVAETIF